MKKIPSFTINHEKLLRGIYVSRKDQVGSDVVTTFDIRMKEPNREPAISGPGIHAMEHLAATYLRNNEEWKDRVIYWGPMGCLTGNYLLLRGDLESKDIVELMKETFRFRRSARSHSPRLRQLFVYGPGRSQTRSEEISGGGVKPHDRSQPCLSDIERSVPCP